MQRRPAEPILAALRTDILTLKLAPGEKLLTEHLAAGYGVGQSPLREALSQLVGEGLVTRESRRGFRVSRMSMRDLDDLIHARLTLEPALLVRAIHVGVGAWEAEVRAALAALQPSLQKVGDERPLDRQWEDCHRRFHFALMTVEGPSVLTELCSMIYDRYDRYRVLGIPRRAYLAGVANDHHEMAQAALARDTPRAVDTLRGHIVDTSQAVRSNIMAGGLIDEAGRVQLATCGTDFA